MSEKGFKPVPDVEALKYKGTPEKPDIKIFVSHRIDLDSEVIDNPLYIPVRCGAVYDERENVTMLGDDTGDNISEKCDYYGYLTVLYWAWKNCQSEYVGFNDEKTYIAFDSPTKKDSTKSSLENYSCFLLNKEICKTYGLSYDKAPSTVCKNDIIVPLALEVTSTKEYSFIESYYLSLTFSNNVNDLEEFIAITKELFPELQTSVEKYVNSKLFIPYLSFVMKQKYFDEYCSYLFEILKALENKIDTKFYSKAKTAQFQIFALLFLGIYATYLKEKNSNKVTETSVLSIESTDKANALLPAYEKNSVPIVLVCSNEYAPYLSVYLQSLLEQSSKSHNYDIIVFHKQITKENQWRLTGMCKDHPNISLRFYNPKQRLNNTSFYVAQQAYCEEAYYRLFAPWYMEHYNKAIVMDCDILVRRDLADLFDIDLGENYVAGVIDAVFQGMLNGWAAPDTLKYAKNEMKMKNPHGYLNTGVLLMDFNKIRENFTETYILKLAKEKHFRCQEQDVLNVILEGHVKFLSLAWNCYVRSGDFVSYGLKWAPKRVYEEFLDAIENPYLVHYVAYPKPWLDPRIEYGQQFWITARKTPYYETILFLLMEGRYGSPIYNLQSRTGIFDPRTGARKFADKVLPKGSHRREFAKKLLPKGSRRWRFCKQIYYIFKPQYRPAKEKKEDNED